MSAETVAVLSDRYVLAMNYIKTIKGIQKFDLGRHTAHLYDGSTYIAFTNPDNLVGLEINRYVLIGNPSSELVEAAILRLR
jgi:hypothetical protein